MWFSHFLQTVKFDLTGCLILFFYTLIGWYGNNNDFLAIKMVFICSTHNEIWYHVVLIRVVPHILTHYAFEKKWSKIFLKIFPKFLGKNFQKFSYGSQMKIYDL